MIITKKKIYNTDVSVSTARNGLNFSYFHSVFIADAE